ncbi:hypothetical protein HY041_04540 [Candidatus Roizmanbacteria bacterium]|nr:hypothetical protein [Candidatus Roizmanbacteria bacterium]
MVINKNRNLSLRHILVRVLRLRPVPSGTGLRLMKKNFFGISKRQKFIITVVSSSLILFLAEQILGKSGIYIAFFLSFFTIILLFLSVRKDLKNNFSPQIFILPFFYSLAFGLFYFLVPARFLTRIAITLLYALGLYSLLLTVNIFVVSSIRTIALLSSARTVSFIITLLSYFFLANVVFSMHLNVFLTLILVFGFSFPLILYSLWTYSLDSKFFSYVLWVASLSLSLVEVTLVLWFWPILPTIIALFLTGFFYIIVGLSQVWLEKKLFKSVMWEYIWVGVLVFLVFIFFAFVKK